MKMKMNYLYNEYTNEYTFSKKKWSIEKKLQILSIIGIVFFVLSLLLGFFSLLDSSVNMEKTIKHVEKTPEGYIYYLDDGTSYSTED